MLCRMRALHGAGPRCVTPFDLVPLSGASLLYESKIVEPGHIEPDRRTRRFTLGSLSAPQHLPEQLELRPSSRLGRDAPLGDIMELKS